MSVGQLWDYGFVINFGATHVYLQKGKLLLIGTRYPTSGLYYIIFVVPTHPPHFMNPTDLTLAPLSTTIGARA